MIKFKQENLKMKKLRHFTDDIVFMEQWLKKFKTQKGKATTIIYYFIDKI